MVIHRGFPHTRWGARVLRCAVAGVCLCSLPLETLISLLVSSCGRGALAALLRWCSGVAVPGRCVGTAALGTAGAGSWGGVSRCTVGSLPPSFRAPLPAGVCWSAEASSLPILEYCARLDNCCVSGSVLELLAGCLQCCGSRKKPGRFSFCQVSKWINLFLKIHQAVQLNIVLGWGDDSFALDTTSATGILQSTVCPTGRTCSSGGLWTVVVLVLCANRRKKWDLVLIVLEDEMLPSSKRPHTWTQIFCHTKYFWIASLGINMQSLWLLHFEIF